VGIDGDVTDGEISEWGRLSVDIDDADDDDDGVGRDGRAVAAIAETAAAAAASVSFLYSKDVFSSLTGSSPDGGPN
jgi:hypothetical protein